MILGVITIYILFGLVAGETNQLIFHFDPHAFSGNLDPSDKADLRYYSYVTMTTLGYGDIVPVSQIARASAVFFSLIGQIYLAVVIALIVGKYVSASDRKESRK
jgi:voltage-gated potassium channel Kch